ncbi:MAG: gamma-glutamyltransferase family protein [Burkholderiales bacterium]|nr:gamma-glutamyltransferase family protein [Burkholderiales bacterium]
MLLTHQNHGYPSVRLPVYARNLVATSHPLGAQAGLRMLAQGGNAVDAAVAAAAVMTVVEPVSNGLGSDAFALVWDGQRLHGLNASGRAPQAWVPGYFTHRLGADALTPPKRGIDSVTVPGAVSGWVALSERFGRLPFADLMQPAIEVAERGFAVPTVVQGKWAAAVPELHRQPGFAEAFLPKGRAPELGEWFQFAAAARGLRSIAATRGESFYRGDIAQAMARFVAAHGGALTEADLAAHAPEWVEPVGHAYRGHTLHELPPNGQGIAAQMALGLLSHFDLASLPVDGPACMHLQIEAMKLAFADVYRYVAEPAAMQATVAQLLDPSYLADRARLIDPRRARAPQAGSPADPHRQGGTIYLTAADEQGMMVSFIQSNYMGFGSGCVEPSFGISLQNRGHGFGLPASPLNPANLVAPGKRPFHTIIPAFLTRPALDDQGREWMGADGQPVLEPVMSFGVMGANMQPQGHVQTLVRLLDHGQPLQAACDAPRWRFNTGLSLNVEAGMDPATVQGLRALGHCIDVLDDPYQDFGAGQFIWRLGDPAKRGYVAASDPRRDGLVAGW